MQEQAVWVTVAQLSDKYRCLRATEHAGTRKESVRRNTVIIYNGQTQCVLEFPPEECSSRHGTQPLLTVHLWSKLFYTTKAAHRHANATHLNPNHHLRTLTLPS